MIQIYIKKINHIRSAIQKFIEPVLSNGTVPTKQPALFLKCIRCGVHEEEAQNKPSQRIGLNQHTQK